MIIDKTGSPLTKAEVVPVVPVVAVVAAIALPSVLVDKTQVLLVPLTYHVQYEFLAALHVVSSLQTQSFLSAHSAGSHFLANHLHLNPVTAIHNLAAASKAAVVVRGVPHA